MSFWMVRTLRAEFRSMPRRITPLGAPGLGQHDLGVDDGRDGLDPFDRGHLFHLGRVVAQRRARHPGDDVGGKTQELVAEFGGEAAHHGHGHDEGGHAKAPPPEPT